MTQGMTGGPVHGSDVGYEASSAGAGYAGGTMSGPGRTASTTGPDTDAGTADLARQEAGDVANTAKEAGGQVVGVTAEQAKQVAGEVRDQARDLMHEGRQQVREQAVAGQQKAAGGLSTVADELRRMAGGSDGVVGDLARQGADRAQEFAEWLRDREPGDLLDEVRGWARQRPGTFLIGAALAGVLAGRLTRGTIAARQGSTDSGNDNGHPAAAVPPPVTPAVTALPDQGQPVTRGSYGGAMGDPAVGVDPGPAAVPASPHPADAREARPSDFGGLR